MSDTTADTATTTDTATTAPVTDATADTGEDTTDWKAEAEKYKGLHRKQEERAKANADAAKELERVKREALPEQERLTAEAEARGAATATAKLAARIVDAEVKAAAAGRSVDIDALLEGLDRTKFMTDDGEPDSAAITAWVDRIAPKATEGDASLLAQPGAFLDLSQGARPAGSEALNGDPLLAGIQKQLGIR